MRVCRLERTTYLIGGILSFAACGLTSCGVERSEPFDGDPAFRMSQPARLYFANIRANRYYHERPLGTELDVYRLKSISQTAKRPLLIPVIVQAYTKDEAYVFVKPNDYPGLSEPLHIEFASPTRTGHFQAGNGTRPEQRALADSLQASLLRGDSVYVRLAGDAREPVFTDHKERSDFLTVMLDYRALIERGGKALRSE